MEPRKWDASDDALMEELREAMDAPANIPESLVDAAKAAFAWRNLDEELELLSLSFDSALAEPALVRSAVTTPSRILVFESEDATMTLEVGGQVLMGQVVPARSDRVALEGPEAVLDEIEADESGFFLLRRPPAGPIRLRWHGAGASVVTEWVAI